MELRTIVGCYEIEDRQGQNKEMLFKLTVPANFSWEALHAALANFAVGAKEWENLNKKKDEPAAEEVAAEPVAPEIVA